MSHTFKVLFELKSMGETCFLGIFFFLISLLNILTKSFSKISLVSPFLKKKKKNSKLTHQMYKLDLNLLYS